MKKLKNVLVTLLSVLMMLTLFTGCSDDSAEESDALGYVSFSDGGGSRSLETENQTLYGVEDLYWAYTAEKVRGNYTTGQSRKMTTAEHTFIVDGISPEGSVTDGVVAKSCLDGETMYKLTPVKQGPAKGLAEAVVSPFSVGEWRIKLYGFKSYNAVGGRFEGLVYKGTTGSTWVSNWSASGAPATVDDIVTVDKRPDNSPKIITFSLSSSDGLGELDFNPITLTVPEKEAFYGPEYGGLSYANGTRESGVEPSVRVIVLDMKNIVSGGVPQVIAVSTTKIKFDDFDNPKNAVFNAGDLVKTYSRDADGNPNNALNAFVKVKDAATVSVATKTLTDGSGTALSPQPDPAALVNQFSDGFADIAFITLYQDGYTVGENTWTLAAEEVNWKDRYDYNDYLQTSDPNGDLSSSEAIKSWFQTASKYYYNVNDGTIYYDYTGTTRAARAAYEAAHPERKSLINGWALVGNIAAYPIGFTSGVKTYVGGDLNDLLGSKGESQDVEFGTAVARITWKTANTAAGERVDKYNPHAQQGSAWFMADNVGSTSTTYTSLEDAIKDYDDFFTAGKVTDADGDGSDKVALCVISEQKPYIELLTNIEGAKLQRSATTAGSYDDTKHVGTVMLLADNKFIKNLEIPVAAETTADVTEKTRTVVIAPKFNYAPAPTTGSETDAQKKAREDSQYTSGKFEFSTKTYTIDRETGKESATVTDNSQVLRNFNFKDDGSRKVAWIFTEPKDTPADNKKGGTLYIDGTGSTMGIEVFNSGIVSKVTVRNVYNTNDDPNRGYMLGTRKDNPTPSSGAAAFTTNVGILNIVGKGTVQLGGSVCVNRLMVKCDTEAVTPVALTTGNVKLNAKSDAVVWQYGYDSSTTATAAETMLRTAVFPTDGTANKSTTVVSELNTQDTDAPKAGFKEIVLNQNDGTTNGKKYMYGIKGLGVELPQFTTTSGTDPVSLFTNTGKTFMHWSSKAAPAFPAGGDDWGKRYEDKGVVIPGYKPEDGTILDSINLFVLWAQPLGGRLFALGSGYDTYHFYGVADGSVNELTEWKNATTDSAHIKKLESAFYYSTTSEVISTTPPAAYVAYAKMPSTTGRSVTAEVTFFEYTDSSSGSAVTTRKFAWDATELDRTKAEAAVNITSITTDISLGKGAANTASAINPDTNSTLTGNTPSLGTGARKDSIWNFVKNQNIEDKFGFGLKDWFIGSEAEYEALKLVAPSMFDGSGYDIWSSCQDSADDTYVQLDSDGNPVEVTPATDPVTYVQVPYKGHAFFYDRVTGDWGSDWKYAEHYVIPIRTIPVTPAP